MDLQILESWSWVAAIFGTVLAVLVTIDQLGIRLRRRHSADFWQQQVLTAENEQDKHTFRAIHRRVMSRIVASAWLPVHHVYIPLAFGAAGATIIWIIGYEYGTTAFQPESIDLGKFTWAGAFISASILLGTLSIALTFGEIFALAIQRNQVRCNFLSENKIEPPTHRFFDANLGSANVLRGATGMRGVLSPFLLAIGASQIIMSVSYVWGLIARPGDPSEPIAAIILSISAAFFISIGGSWAFDAVRAESPGHTLLYPPQKHQNHESLTQSDHRCNHDSAKTNHKDPS